VNLHLEQSSYRVKLEEAYENILGFSEHVDVRTVVEELGWKILGSKTVDVKILSKRDENTYMKMWEYSIRTSIWDNIFLHFLLK